MLLFFFSFALGTHKDSCNSNSCIPNTTLYMFSVFFLSSVLSSYSCIFSFFRVFHSSVPNKPSRFVNWHVASSDLWIAGGLKRCSSHRQPVREAVNDRELFTAGWFGVREKHCCWLEIYDRLWASEQALWVKHRQQRSSQWKARCHAHSWFLHDMWRMW